MSVYLYHYPLFYYLDHEFGLGKNTHVVGPQKVLYFLFNIVTAMIVGAFFALSVEEPARNVLKSTSNRRKQQQNLEQTKIVGV